MGLPAQLASFETTDGGFSEPKSYVAFGTFAGFDPKGLANGGSTLLPAPDGLLGMPDGMKRAIPGFDPDEAKNRRAARAIMEKLGYGP